MGGEPSEDRRVRCAALRTPCTGGGGVLYPLNACASTRCLEPFVSERGKQKNKSSLPCTLRYLDRNDGPPLPFSTLLPYCTFGIKAPRKTWWVQ